MMGQVEGKVAIVTGGALGIGAACAETLARAGAQVVVSDIDDAGGGALVDRIKRGGGKAIYRSHDVTSEAGWPALIDAAEALGGLHIVVANAGITHATLVVDLSLEAWRRQMAVNLDGVFLSVKHAIPAMRRSGGGSIVILSSVAGLRGTFGSSAYCASKGGVRLFAKAVAMECAWARDNIRVNTIHPGVIDTPLWSKLPTAVDPRQLGKAVVPIGRAGTAQDVANGVLFLSSDASSYMTGTEFVIDGGFNAGAIPPRLDLAGPSAREP
jgi:NAD(P)-dependent dehydrogenase (short-subunit alcohol dehydrogenase family)